MKLIRLTLSAIYILAAISPTYAQREPLSDTVRERALSRDVLDPYWNGFIAKAQGNCQLAVQELKSYANQGRGYEDAQTAFGVCQMIEAGFNPTDKKQAPSLIEDPAFIEGRRFVLKAAQSGFHEAQAELVRLYLIGLGPDQDPIEGAKWAQLYLSNPYRLTIGLVNEIERDINALRVSMTSEQWVLGKERARNWYPVFNIVTDTPLIQQNTPAHKLKNKNR